MFNWQGRASKADMAGLQSSLNIQVTLTDQVEFQVALGEHFELPNGIQLALGGQLEGPGESEWRLEASLREPSDA